MNAQSCDNLVPRSVHDASVVILGGGPVGSTMAALLNQSGVRTTLLEQKADFLEFSWSRTYGLALKDTTMERIQTILTFADALISQNDMAPNKRRVL